MPPLSRGGRRTAHRPDLRCAGICLAAAVRLVVVRQVRPCGAANLPLGGKWPAGAEWPVGCKSEAECEAKADREHAGRPTAIEGDLIAHAISMTDLRSPRPSAARACEVFGISLAERDAADQAAACAEDLAARCRRGGDVEANREGD